MVRRGYYDWRQYFDSRALFSMYARQLRGADTSLDGQRRFQCRIPAEVGMAARSKRDVIISRSTAAGAAGAVYHRQLHYGTKPC